jgi:hypothetical protein
MWYDAPRRITIKPYRLRRNHIALLPPLVLLQIAAVQFIIRERLRRRVAYHPRNREPPSGRPEQRATPSHPHVA